MRAVPTFTFTPVRRRKLHSTILCGIFRRTCNELATYAVISAGLRMSFRLVP